MKQTKSFHPIKNKTYSTFEKEQALRKKAKLRRKHNLDHFTMPDSEHFMFTTDLDTAIDELTSSWEI